MIHSAVIAIFDYGLPFVLGNKYDIEHIMPQSGANLDIIRKDAQIENKDEFDDFVNKLGNKIYLSRKKAQKQSSLFSMLL